MRRQYTRMAVTLLGVAAAAVTVFTVVHGSGPDMDRRSYQKGYGAFADTWLPASGDGRATDAAYCEQLWGSFPADELAGLVQDDWVAGCADYREGKDSQF